MMRRSIIAPNIAERKLAKVVGRSVPGVVIKPLRSVIHPPINDPSIPTTMFAGMPIAEFTPTSILASHPVIPPKTNQRTIFVSPESLS